MTVLQIKNLSLKYGNHYIFRNLSFAVEKNDFLCIVGPNGSGKSTLLKCLLGEIKPNQGEIQFENHSQRKVIGYLPQNPHYNPSFPASVYEAVASGSLNQIGLFSKYPKQKIEKALGTLRITDIARQQFSTLSGGQRQRVLLARALDYNSKQEFYRTLEKLNKSTTILMVTHDLDHNNLIGNKILSLDPNLPFFGTTKEYVRRIHAH